MQKEDQESLEQIPIEELQKKLKKGQNYLQNIS